MKSKHPKRLSGIQALAVVHFLQAATDAIWDQYHDEIAAFLDQRCSTLPHNLAGQRGPVANPYDDLDGIDDDLGGVDEEIPF